MVWRIPTTASALKWLRRYRYSIDNSSPSITARSIGTLVTPWPMDLPKVRSVSLSSCKRSSIGKFSNTTMLSNNACPPRLDQRCTSASGAWE
ncbi:hypothetical protein D3C81_959770 [compost metagenome]